MSPPSYSSHGPWGMDIYLLLFPSPPVPAWILDSGTDRLGLWGGTKQDSRRTPGFDAPNQPPSIPRPCRICMTSSGTTQASHLQM